jgi:L-2-hydroxycarboxylate dehydrogenase (NAD+)
MDISIKEIRTLAEEVIMQRGLSRDETSQILDHLVEAELTGRQGHGFIRVMRLCRKLQEDSLQDIKVTKDTPVSALLDGGNRPGVVVATKATDIAIEKAKNNHVGIVGGYNTDAIYVAGFYVRKIAKEGLVGVLTCNSVAAVAPWGSIDSIMGTNPLAIAVPTSGEPIVLDFSTSKANYGDVLVAAKKGEKVPNGILIDKNGNPTNDPNDLEAGGVLLPIAGYKGSGLSFMLEILAGPMINAKGGNKAVSGSWGFLVMAIDPKIFASKEELDDRIDRLVREVKASRRATNVDEILLPGERSNRMRQNRLSKDTLSIPDQIVKDIRALRL